MKLLAFIPIKITLLLILGILIGYLFPINTTYLLCSLILFLAILTAVFIIQKNSTTKLFGIVAAITIILLGSFCYSTAQPINNSNHYSKSTTPEDALWNLKIKEVLKPNQFSNRYFARVNSVNNKSTTGTLLVSIPKDSLSDILRIDDEIITYGSIQNISEPLNPHQFNYKNYLKHFGVYDQLRINPTQFIKVQNSEATLIGAASKARKHIIKKLKENKFGKDELSIIQALLLGQRSDISEETYANYQKAGAVHILAVSGLHIGILLALIQFLLRPIKYLPHGRKMILLFSVLFLWGFAFLAGLSASIIRATTMFTFVAFALYLNRPSNSFNILALSVMFILLFINPNLLFQVGFQMSYAAVFAILWIYPLLEKLWFPKNKIVRYFWQLFCVSIAAQLGVLPISLYYFHQFPGLFFISNLLIIPALGIILGVGIFIIFLSLVNWLPTELVWLYNELIKGMNSVIEWVAKQEGFIFSSISFDVTQLILSFIVLALLINTFKKFTYKRIALLLIGIICFQGYGTFKIYEAFKTREVIVVHQTRNTVIINRNGRTIEVLTNDQSRGGNIITDYKTGERIENIKYDSLKNSYSIQNSTLQILDSVGVYVSDNTTHRILLTQSPKINLERLIENNDLTEIIADGSNYRSYINRWKFTCLKNKIPFHYTGEKGAYYFKENNQ